MLRLVQALLVLVRRAVLPWLAVRLPGLVRRAVLVAKNGVVLAAAVLVVPELAVLVARHGLELAAAGLVVVALVVVLAATTSGLVLVLRLVQA